MTGPGIRGDLQLLAKPIDGMRPHPANTFHEGDVGAIVMSLRRFGQLRAILVQASTGYIVAGNHTWMGAKSDGWTEIAAAVVDLTDAECEAYLAADNRIARLAKDDPAGLAAHLAKLNLDDNLEGTGYDQDDVDAAIAAAHRIADETLADQRAAEEESTTLDLVVICPDEDARADVAALLSERGYTVRPVAAYQKAGRR